MSSRSNCWPTDISSIPKALPRSGKSPEAAIAALLFRHRRRRVSPKQHVDIQAAAQKWIDSSISKTANVPPDFPYEDFKDIYRYAYEQGLKGCTTFRFNPEAFQGVLVKEKDLANTLLPLRTRRWQREMEVKGNEEIEYDGESHTALPTYLML
jgi:ribonucleoside-diphosphate reductase alpha chain